MRYQAFSIHNSATMKRYLLIRYFSSVMVTIKLPKNIQRIEVAYNVCEVKNRTNDKLEAKKWQNKWKHLYSVGVWDLKEKRFIIN
jgi:hypothetical protein